MVGICYVAPDVPIPHQRGASTHVLELARALQQLGNQVHVVCRRERFQSSEETISGVVFHRLYRGLLFPLPGSEPSIGPAGERADVVSTAYSLYLGTFNALFAGLFAVRLIRSHGLQVIIERETAFGAGAVASVLSRRPMILEIIGPKTSWLSTHVSSRILAYNEKMVSPNALKKTVFVKAAVNPELFKPDSAARMRVRKKLSIDDSIVVGYVGTFQSWHGLEDLIRAAKMLRHFGPKLKFLLVGPLKSNAASFSDAGDDSLILTGPVPYEAVPDYINAADITVAPYNVLNSSRKDKGIGSPLKVLEYMACGKPTIGSSLPQVASIIEDGKTGFLFPQGDVSLLARRIEELARNSSLREEMGRYALERVRKEYTWVSFAQRTLSQIEECVTQDQDS
ncbi:MAG: glycosyltransferase family 4 protein [Nitrososphaerales archaeon]|jgi:glycosyltransferase involved in cell wall biosynthesis